MRNEINDMHTASLIARTGAIRDNFTEHTLNPHQWFLVSIIFSSASTLHHKIHERM